jgi:hypothetical protein
MTAGLSSRNFVDGIAGIQAEASAFLCVFSGGQSQTRFDGLARDLRRTLTRHLDRVFAEAFPRLPKDDRSRMLAAWSDITGAMIANLDRSKPGERGKLLERTENRSCRVSRRQTGGVSRLIRSSLLLHSTYAGASLGQAIC